MLKTWGFLLRAKNEKKSEMEAAHVGEADIICPPTEKATLYFVKIQDDIISGSHAT